MLKSSKYNFFLFTIIFFQSMSAFADRDLGNPFSATKLGSQIQFLPITHPYPIAKNCMDRGLSYSFLSLVYNIGTALKKYESKKQDIADTLEFRSQLKGQALICKSDRGIDTCLVQSQTSQDLKTQIVFMTDGNELISLSAMMDVPVGPFWGSEKQPISVTYAPAEDAYNRRLRNRNPSLTNQSAIRIPVATGKTLVINQFGSTMVDSTTRPGDTFTNQNVCNIDPIIQTASEQ